ncbi:MAG: hypothetical protein MJ211_09615 [Bacteroidales bacterium]|nr:hypothetical protein [Bacteroidales bacterium]
MNKQIEPKISKEDFDNIVHLYQQLTLEQCKELFFKQKTTFNQKLKIAVKIIIASKFLYGEEKYLNYIQDKQQNSK